MTVEHPYGMGVNRVLRGGRTMIDRNINGRAGWCRLVRALLFAVPKATLFDFLPAGVGSACRTFLLCRAIAAVF